MYTLYYAPGAASMAVHLALLELGVPYRLERLDLKAGAQHAPAYRALNPHGTVPTLLVEGHPRSETIALLILLAERHPQSALAPAPGTDARAAWLQWLVHLGNAPMPLFRLLAYPADLGAERHAPETRAALERRLEACWDFIDAHVTKAGPYLLGAACTSADLLLAMLMRWSRHAPRPATAWPALARLADLVRTRPSWRRVHELEGLAAW
ncbi:glutathione S-transferase family protein [Frateuria defendens]|uniref:glutathione S-transferase family protein n=1 Tax=Frateuria defendens TaxID=2219559 RepID=UPI00066FD77A|nr:glutathione S-transferase [Frateuria defendens]